MNIQNLINHDIKQAMLAKDVEKLAALRSVKSAFLLEASKDGRSEISDEIALDPASALQLGSRKIISMPKGSRAFFMPAYQPSVKSKPIAKGTKATFFPSRAE